jgi:hypothetical protein
MMPRTILVPCRRWRIKFAQFKCSDSYSEVSSDMVSANAKIISTRWVISKKINDDGTWRSKARLVAREYEDKEKDRVSSDSPVLRLRLKAFFWRYWLRNSGFQTLGNLQQPFSKVSPSPVTFLSCRRLTLSAVFCRPDQCSLTNSYVDDNSCLISE